MTTSTDILKAAASAAKWLKKHAKRNPIPYPFFKSIINNQIIWGKAQRGVILDFSELAQAARSELLKFGIYVMAESGGKNSEPNATKAHAENSVSADFVCNGCGGRNVDKKECPLYNVSVRNRAGGACTFMCAFYHDSQNCQMPATGEISNQEDSHYEQ